jgi:hypothetical protein
MDIAQLNVIGKETANAARGKYKLDEVSFVAVDGTDGNPAGSSGSIVKGGSVKLYSMNSEQIHKLLSYSEPQVTQFLQIYLEDQARWFLGIR